MYMYSPSMISLTLISRLRKFATFVSNDSSANDLRRTTFWTVLEGSCVWNQHETSEIETSAFSDTKDLLKSQPFTGKIINTF